MTPITIGSHVRDRKTRLTGKVERIYTEARPHTDLLAIRLDKPHALYGTVLSAFVGEVEILGEEGATV